VRARIAAIALAASAGCNGSTGTISIGLTTAPGSHVLDDVQTLHLTITSPLQDYMIPRTADGFDLAIDISAMGETSKLRIDGLDAQQHVIASGASPAFPIAPIDARIVVYMAPPMSIGEAPVRLPAAVADLGAAPLSYGAVFAGGTAATGAPVDTLSIYNAFDHTLVAGAPLPAPRSGPLLGAGANNIVYVFGGLDAASAPTDTFWRFDTTVAPRGAYSDFGSKPGFARAGELLVPVGNDQFLMSGMPAGEAFGITGAVSPRTEVTELPRAGATVTASDGKVTTLFVGAALGAGGAARLRDGAFDFPEIPAAARSGQTVVALPNGKFLVVCGGPEALRIDAATAAVETITGLPKTPRHDCAAVATPRHLVVIGGQTPVDDLNVLDAEVYDVVTLQLVATIPLTAARIRAFAIALPDDQVLIAGGGTPTDVIDLFTPANP
jgi:hypothetical protein